MNKFSFIRKSSKPFKILSCYNSPVINSELVILSKVTLFKDTKTIYLSRDCYIYFFV